MPNIIRGFLPALAVVLAPMSVHAALLHPSHFVSSGSFVSIPGRYSLNTDSLSLSGPGGFEAAGTIRNGTAVFLFDDFVLGPGADLTAIGSRPAAILSLTNIAVGGNGIDVWSGGGRGGLPAGRGGGPGGGRPGFNFFGGAGGGGGFGGPGGRGQFDNPTFSFPGAGGPAYGNLEVALQGGSGGGGGKSNSRFQSAGGDGGGALELGALRSIEITSSLTADGQRGQPRGFNHTGGGGGSGGGLIVHAPYVVNRGIISANGGRGGDGVFENGGGGGGGRILLNTVRDGLTNLGLISVAGGSAPSDFFGAGIPGRRGSIKIRATLVPEPSSIAVVGLFALSAAPYLRRKSAHRTK